MTRLRLIPAIVAVVLLASPAPAAPDAGPASAAQPRFAASGQATLVVTLCAEDAPTRCDVQRSPLYDPPALCLMPAQLAQFARPGWRIARWRCERDG